MKRSVNISLFVMTWKRRATSTADQSKLHEWSVRLQRAGQAEFTLSSKHRLFTGLPQEQKFTGTSVFKAHMMVIDIKMLPSERTAYCMWSWSYPQPKSFAENTVNTPYTNSLCLKFKVYNYLIHKIETKSLKQQKFQVNPKHNSSNREINKTTDS